jgi:hypothetical protein
MVSTAPLLGTVPTLVERLAALEHLAAEQAERICALAERVAVLESARDVNDAIDGPAPPPALAPSWKPIKQAASLVGYSEPGLRKAKRRHADGPRWWRYLGGRLFVDIDRCPRPVRT